MTRRRVTYGVAALFCGGFGAVQMIDAASLILGGSTVTRLGGSAIASATMTFGAGILAMIAAVLWLITAVHPPRHLARWAWLALGAAVLLTLIRFNVMDSV